MARISTLANLSSATEVRFQIKIERRANSFPILFGQLRWLISGIPHSRHWPRLGVLFENAASHQEILVRVRDGIKCQDAAKHIEGFSLLASFIKFKRLLINVGECDDGTITGESKLHFVNHRPNSLAREHT